MACAITGADGYELSDRRPEAMVMKDEARVLWGQVAAKPPNAARPARAAREDRRAARRRLDRPTPLAYRIFVSPSRTVGMKTTIELPGDLLERGKAVARRENSTLKALIEEGLN